ncbi:cytochrome P450 [Nocardioides acrostichi]|uniref:Cytochrome P450 n=1 Tax=Nocardioides acrostichi TaxID=2784339 RepID=A0A930USP2_9ACTN|nr:cytochrome P450 [Nocardioides acrostichi]MBF4160123.1 cytochrome P450 [Nocardioides acrostichi]
MVTTAEQAREVLTNPRTFAPASDVSRGGAVDASARAPRPSASAVRVATDVFAAELIAATEVWRRGGVADAMQVLRLPVARSTVRALLPEAGPRVRDELADLTLAWIDALGPVIASSRPPGRWSRLRRRESRARLAVEGALAAHVDPAGDPRRRPPVLAASLAAGVQVPIAAGAWLLVLLAKHRPVAQGAEVVPGLVWETLRLRPPTWILPRVTTGEIDLGGERLPASAVVLVSPLLLGRDASLVPGTDLDAFVPGRWTEQAGTPGSWLPFGVGPHACPGRSLGLAQLTCLATWANALRWIAEGDCALDQSRGIFPRSALLRCTDARD